MLLQRYRGEPAIAWFEYFNEPDFANGALRRFYDEMGTLAASIDPSRLFSSGTIADYAVGGANNYRNLNESPGVDIASLHEYDANLVESQHGPVARANGAARPATATPASSTSARARNASQRKRVPTSPSTDTSERWPGRGSPAIRA
jgi:hypothetical protein